MSLLTDCSNEKFTIIVQSSNSIAECEKKIGYNSYSGSVASLIRSRIQELGLDISHFTKIAGTVRSPENIFIENSTASQSTLRKYYKQGDYSSYVCDICGQEPFWQGQELTLILDHKNGINNDDRIENLHWVCPNCNQQLETTGSKNKAYKDSLKTQKKYYCIDCQTEVFRDSIRCKKCAGILRQTTLPISRDELKTLIRTTSFTEIGKKFGVSDNAIRKWCDKYCLPRTIKEIKTYSELDWSKI